MHKTKYRGYFSEEIIVKSPYPEVTAPAVRYDGDRGGDDLTFDWTCVTQPMTVDAVPRCPERDQFIFFAGSNLHDFSEFGAKITLCLGSEKTEVVITEPKLVYVPRGLVYGPIVFSEVTKPVVWMNFFVGPNYSKGWAGGDYSQYVATPNIVSDIFHTRTEVMGNLLYEQRWPKQQMIVLGDALGPEGANFCLFYYAVHQPYYMTEPTHTHTWDMWLINLGGNALNVEEFGGEVTMWWGQESEKLICDSTSVAHVPAGLIHRGLFFHPMGKPFIHIHTYTAGGPIKDVVFDDEGKPVEQPTKS
ncbi:MAG: hypothetical protein N3B14_00885 [Thermoleophilia bacterium]|nr:hypothetical protein [Thermoleophilia bacterium]